MSLEHFWNNLSNAKNELDLVENIKRDLRQNPTASAVIPTEFWPTPQAVEGFDRDDFWYLPKDQQQQLAGLVEEFASIVRPMVHDFGTWKGESLKRAEEILRSVMEIMELGNHRDALEFRVSKIVELCRKRLKNGDDVSDIRFQIEEDSTGEPALWVWVILEDEATKGNRFFEITRQIRSDLTRMLRAYGVELRPFIHFRSRSEQDEVGGEHP
jgi:hypothetical protein